MPEDVRFSFHIDGVEQAVANIEALTDAFVRLNDQAEKLLRSWKQIEHTMNRVKEKA